MLSGTFIIHAMVALVLSRCAVAVSGFEDAKYLSVKAMQKQNIDILEQAIPLGWKAFCDAPVDESVMSLFNGINPSDAVIRVLTLTNQSVELPIKALSTICDYDISPKRKTLLFVNGYHSAESHFSVQSHLQLLQTTRRDLNVVVLEFVQNVEQLYFAVRHHVTVQGMFVAKVLAALTQGGISPHDITLAGHSVGANIAALGASLYAKQQPTATKVGQLIAIDPALMCDAADVSVRRDVAMLVVVLHGEGQVFGVREQRGTIDIYPNGVGNMKRRKQQPGCSTPLCSHMYAFVLFMESVIEGVMIPAVKCGSWYQFRNNTCDYRNTIAIGLKYPEVAAGSYFCVTQPNPPFTYMEHGLKYRKTL